jgi:hypothetical protein
VRAEAAAVPGRGSIRLPNVEPVVWHRVAAALSGVLVQARGSHEPDVRLNTGTFAQRSSILNSLYE